MKEVWKDISEYEGLYQVSNLGNVRSLDRTVVYQNERKTTHKGKLLKPNVFKNGYVYFGLSKNGKLKYHRVHRLVADAFLTKTENRTQVNHKDKNKLNNCVDNLEWCSASENQIHAYRLGRKFSTQEAHRANRIALCVYRDNVFVAQYDSIKSCARALHLDAWTISQCLKHKRTLKGYNFTEV